MSEVEKDYNNTRMSRWINVPTLTEFEQWIINLGIVHPCAKDLEFFGGLSNVMMKIHDLYRAIYQHEKLCLPATPPKSTVADYSVLCERLQRAEIVCDLLAPLLHDRFDLNWKRIAHELKQWQKLRDDLNEYHQETHQSQPDDLPLRPDAISAGGVEDIQRPTATPLPDSLLSRCDVRFCPVNKPQTEHPVR